ncbi:prepilin-type N-terminal cleavage/methylation domain-containing protein [Parelusimicrobium proximum]|uniref:type IV pilin protein n=1 Tax=Parelusimicrobium proximum TaxID=3228953 RepID=UPI003D16A089
MKKDFKNNHVGAESLSARLDGVHYSGLAEKDSAPTIRKRSPRRDDLNKSSLLRTSSSSLPLYSVGFTLIELLVVVLIIAILAAVALPQYTSAVEKSRATEALILGKALKDAQARYYLQNDDYATSTDQLDVTPPANTKYHISIENPHGISFYRNGTSASDSDYWISFYYPTSTSVPDGIRCASAKEKGIKVCRSLSRTCGTGTTVICDIK